MDAEHRHTLLQQARQGDQQALGELLSGFRPYIRMLARALERKRLQGRMGESDLIQDALLEVHRSFSQFRGESVPEFVGWIRQVVIGSVGRTLRAHHAGKRDIGREVADTLAGPILGPDTSPSQHVLQQEQSARMAAALARLPDDMQRVLLGRCMDGLSHGDLASQLNRSEPAVRMLYLRALKRLRDEWVSTSDTGSFSAEPQT